MFEKRLLTKWKSNVLDAILFKNKNQKNLGDMEKGYKVEQRKKPSMDHQLIALDICVNVGNHLICI